MVPGGGGSGDAPLELAGGSRHEEVREKWWWEVRCAGSGLPLPMDKIIIKITTVRRVSFFRGRGRVSFTSVSLARLSPHSTACVMERNFLPRSPSLVASHTDCSPHLHTTTTTTCLSHSNAHRNIGPDRIHSFLLSSFTFSPPLLSLIEVFISTPFPHPPLPFHICCSPSCSSSVDPHCT